MKLLNKKTGEIVVFGEGIVDLNQIGCKNVGEMIEAGWEDYEEPKGEIWWLDNEGNINHVSQEFNNNFAKNREIGNYFSSREEAKKAVEKLKAWKRLKDKGFRLLGYYHTVGETKSKGEIGFEMDDYKGTKQDLDLLFGGEE